MRIKKNVKEKTLKFKDEKIKKIELGTIYYIINNYKKIYLK